MLKSVALRRRAAAGASMHPSPLPQRLRAARLPRAIDEMVADPSELDIGRTPSAAARHGPTVAAALPVADPGLGAKVAFLSRPESYAEPTSRVDTVETHMSWVFLTDRQAWKLKKPVRAPYLDFTTIAGRRQDCDAELRLNRRLATDVYLEIVPLTLDAGGRLRLGEDGAVIDWLIRMRRLPAARMLDRLIRNGAATSDDLRRVVGRLARFYRDRVPVTVTAAAYRAAFRTGIAASLTELCAPAYGLAASLVAAVCARQGAWLRARAELFDERVRAGRIVEAHGDLRPEHICIEPQPQIIDCLEFSRELRTLDAADELAFLALECERLGAPALAAPIFGTYAEATGDAPPQALLEFYQSYRACVRAKLAIRHLDDAAPREPSKWAAQARDYLRLADLHSARLA